MTSGIASINLSSYDISELDPLDESGDRAFKDWYGKLNNTNNSQKAVNAEHWISDSTIYLLTWAGANVGHALSNLADTAGKEIAQSVFSSVAMLALAVDFMGTQSGVVNLRLCEKLKSSLDDLIKIANEKNPPAPLQLAEAMSKCANNLRQLESVPGWVHFCAKVGTDGFADVVSMSRMFYNFVSFGHLRSTAEKLNSLAQGESFGAALSASRTTTALDKAAQHIPTAEQDKFATTLNEQSSNIDQASSASAAFTALGMVGGLANITRGMVELRLAIKAIKNLKEKQEVIKNAKTNLKDIEESIKPEGPGKSGEIVGIEKSIKLKKSVEIEKSVKPEELEKKKSSTTAAGIELLTQVEKAHDARKVSAWSAFVTSIVRALNGAWGIVAGILILCAIPIAGWIAPVVGACILLIYAGKCIVQAIYNRRANRIETRIANYLRMLSKKGSKMYKEFLDHKVLKDLKSLAKGGTKLLNFLKAMKFGHLYASVEEAFVNKNFSERIPILKKVLDICFSSSTAFLEKAIAKNGKSVGTKLPEKSTDTGTGETQQKVYEQISKEGTVRDDKEFGGMTKIKFSVEEKRLFNKFMDNPLEKAIYSCRGTLPGIRKTDRGTTEDIENAAKASIRARVGAGQTTDQIFTILEGLRKNHKDAKDTKFDFVMGIVRGTTWGLTDESKECMKALESQDIKQVSTTTLAAALHEGNIGQIAKLIHGNNKNDVDELTTLLDKANLSDFGKVVAAVDKQDEKTLRSCRSLPQYEKMVKAALMLSGKTRSEAEGLLDSVTIREQYEASDLISVLGIFNGKYSCATFSSTDAATKAHGYLESKQIATKIKGSTLSDVSASNEDPKVHRYIEDIVCGKIALKNVPDWLLNGSLKEALNGKVQKSCEEALRDELRIAMRFHLEGEERSVRSLKWPTMKYYGQGTVATKILRESFDSILNIQTKKATAKGMLHAARVFANFADNRYTDKQLLTLARQGGLVGAVVLRCVTGQFHGTTDIQAREKLKNAHTLEDLKNAFSLPKKEISIKKENVSILSRAGDPGLDSLLEKMLSASNIPFEETHNHDIQTRARLNSLQIPPSHLIEEESNKEGIEYAIGVRRPLANRIYQPQPGEALEYDSPLERIVEEDLDEDWIEYGIRFKNSRIQSKSDGVSEHDSPSEEITDREIEEGIGANITVWPRP